jgi:hypothetical protein
VFKLGSCAVTFDDISELDWDIGTTDPEASKARAVNSNASRSLALAMIIEADNKVEEG